MCVLCACCVRVVCVCVCVRVCACAKAGGAFRRKTRWPAMWSFAVVHERASDRTHVRLFCCWAWVGGWTGGGHTPDELSTGWVDNSDRPPVSKAGHAPVPSRAARISLGRVCCAIALTCSASGLVGTKRPPLSAGSAALPRQPSSPPSGAMSPLPGAAAPFAHHQPSTGGGSGVVYAAILFCTCRSMSW